LHDTVGVFGSSFHHFTVKSGMQTQPPTLSGTGNEYQSKCGGEALYGWGVKTGMAHFIYG